LWANSPLLMTVQLFWHFSSLKSVMVLETEIEVTYRASTDENHYHSPSLPTHNQGSEKIVRKPSVEGEVKVASIFEWLYLRKDCLVCGRIDIHVG
jgi:hypothetical protein